MWKNEAIDKLVRFLQSKILHETGDKELGNATQDLYPKLAVQMFFSSKQLQGRCSTGCWIMVRSVRWFITVLPKVFSDTMPEKTRRMPDNANKKRSTYPPPHGLWKQRHRKSLRYTVGGATAIFVGYTPAIMPSLRLSRFCIAYHAIIAKQPRTCVAEVQAPHRGPAPPEAHGVPRGRRPGAAHGRQRGALLFFLNDGVYGSDFGAPTPLHSITP